MLAVKFDIQSIPTIATWSITFLWQKLGDTADELVIEFLEWVRMKFYQDFNYRLLSCLRLNRFVLVRAMSRGKPLSGMIALELISSIHCSVLSHHPQLYSQADRKHPFLEPTITMQYKFSLNCSALEWWLF